MNCSISYSDLALLSHDVEGNVDKLIDLGADHIEILMDGEQWNDMEEIFDEVSSKLNKKKVEYSIHPPAWDINLTSENKAMRDASFDEYKKAIEFAGMIQASHVVIHPGFYFSPAFNVERGKKRALEYIQMLCDIAKPLNVKLAIENVGYNGTSLYTQQEFANLLDDIDETAGYLIDIGHANLNGWDVPQLIEDVEKRLIALHIHDNDGVGDQHLPMGQGTVEWESIYQKMADLEACQFILEYAPATELQLLEDGKNLILKEVEKVGERK